MAAAKTASSGRVKNAKPRKTAEFVNRERARLNHERAHKGRPQKKG